MEPKKKNTLIGIAGGIFTSAYSNALRHEPIMRGFPGFHLKIITFGAVLGYYIGCYEADAMGQYESLIQRFKEKRGSLAAADEK